MRYERYLPANPIQDKLNFVIANTAIAIEQMLIMATALGLGATVIGGFSDASEFNKLFSLESNLVPVAVVPIGYPAEWPSQRPRRSLEDILIRQPSPALKNR